MQKVLAPMPVRGLLPMEAIVPVVAVMAERVERAGTLWAVPPTGQRINPLRWGAVAAGRTVAEAVGLSGLMSPIP